MKKIFIAIVVVFSISNAAVWHAIYTENHRTTAKELTVAVMDIGQGDAIFVQAPNGNQIVVDGGPDAKVLQELGKLMPWYDKSLDMIVITNPDKDHIAGFINILQRYKVQYLLEPGTQSKTLTHTTVQQLVKEKGVEKVLARRGMKIVLDDRPGEEVVLTVLFPDRDVSMETTNDGSIVARLTYGDTSVMLTGDAPIKVESHLLSLISTWVSTSTGTVDRPDLVLESTILKVGHHGSKTSSSEPFVKAVSPEFAAISDGRGNKYGHPDPETLTTLANFPIKVLRTDLIGTIVFTSDGKSFAEEK